MIMIMMITFREMMMRTIENNEKINKSSCANKTF